MPRLIEQFASTLGASQRANVQVLLTEGNINGEIKTFDDFKAKLESLSAELNLEATPLTSIAFVTANKMITSSSYNDILRLIGLDMESVYTEIDNICQLVDVHRGIQEQSIRDIRDSLAALDTKISTLELLSGDVDYGKAQFNTFDSIGANSLSKLESIASTLYIDPRTSVSLSNVIYEANVDVTREGITLPLESSLQVLIQGVVLEEGEDTTESDLNVDPADNDTNNALIEGDGLYWVRSVLILGEDVYGNSVSPPSDGVTAKIRLDLNGFQEVNSITLVPFTDNSFEIESISYFDVDGAEFAILTEPTAIADEITFTFSRVVTNRITLNLRQSSYSELLDFFYSSVPSDVSDIQSLATSSGLSGMEIGGGGGQLHARGYFYTMGFDFIGVHRSDYRDIGIYVSEALESSSVITEALVDAKIEHVIDDIGNRQDAIEAYMAKLNYDSSGLLVTTEIFPVMYESANIVHEELILVTDLGQTRFFPELSSVVVYRDFSALTIGTDYTMSVNGIDFRDNLTDLMTLDVATGTPQKLQIKMLDPKTTSVYTVSYTPSTSISGAVPLLTGDGNVEFAGRSVHFNYSPDTDIVRSDIHTIFIIRTLNYTAGRETPIVFEYATKIAEV